MKPGKQKGEKSGELHVFIVLNMRGFLQQERKRLKKECAGMSTSSCNICKVSFLACKDEEMYTNSMYG